MKIGIEAQRIFRKKKHGMDIVALELIRNLQRIDTQNEYFIFVKPDEDICLKETSNFKIIEVLSHNYLTWEQFALPKKIKQFEIDIFHCTSNTAPLFLDIPNILTLHDIIYLENRNFLKNSKSWYQSLGNIYRKIIVPQVIRNTSKIITVSDFERNNIISKLNINDNKIVTVYNGVSPKFTPIYDEEAKENCRKKYHLPHDFFIFLGNTDPKKNTGGVLKAYNDYVTKTQKIIPIVITDLTLETLSKYLSEYNLDSNLVRHIILPGYINNEDLPNIYSLSSALLYPSLRESFGLPIIEAMSCGIPVITSNTSSMPEISGNAAILVNPLDPEEISKQLLSIQNDSDKKGLLINKGLSRAKFFSWHNMAVSVLEEYNNLYQSTLNSKIA